MLDNYFKNLKFNSTKLVEFGFKKTEDKFEYSKLILNNAFTIFVYIDEFNNVGTKVIDNAFNEEYILYKLENSEGEFVGKIRSQIENLFFEIKEKCCVSQIFSSTQAQEIIEYIRNKYNSNLEFLWEKFDDTAICRRSDNQKWYLVLMKLNKQKLGLSENKVVEIIDLRVDKNKESIVNNKTIFAGYHMNKKSWITICLDNSLSTQEILIFLDNSYNLAKGKK